MIKFVKKLIERFPKLYSLFKFGISSGVSLLLDYTIYTVIIFVAFDQDVEGWARIALAVVPAATLSSPFNLWVNKKLVFNDQKYPDGYILRYYTIFTVLMMVRIFIIGNISDAIESEVSRYAYILFRLAADVPLFLVSFVVQKLWVFAAAKAVVVENDADTM